MVHVQNTVTSLLTLVPSLEPIPRLRNDLYCVEFKLYYIIPEPIPLALIYSSDFLARKLRVTSANITPHFKGFSPDLSDPSSVHASVPYKNSAQTIYGLHYVI